MDKQTNKRREEVMKRLSVIKTKRGNWAVWASPRSTASYGGIGAGEAEPIVVSQKTGDRLYLIPTTAGLTLYIDDVNDDGTISHYEVLPADYVRRDAPKVQFLFEEKIEETPKIQ